MRPAALSLALAAVMVPTHVGKSDPGPLFKNVAILGTGSFLDVSVEGTIDDATGYVIDLGKLREIVEREVVDVVDHRNFNLDVEFMRGVIPTSENIIVAFWKIIEPAVAPAKLKRLVLWETENNYVEYSGD